MSQHPSQTENRNWHPHQVLVVEIIENGSDVLLFLNGNYIVGADPGCGDSTSSIYSTAASLAQVLGTTVTRLKWPAHEDWQVDEIMQDLIQEGLMVDRSCPAAATNLLSYYLSTPADAGTGRGGQLYNELLASPTKHVGIAVSLSHLADQDVDAFATAAQALPDTAVVRVGNGWQVDTTSASALRSIIDSLGSEAQKVLLAANKVGYHKVVFTQDAPRLENLGAH